MTILSNETINYNKNVTINFEGGNLTSDAGLLAYKAFDEKIRLSKCIQKVFQIKKILFIKRQMFLTRLFIKQLQVIIQITFQIN